MVALGLRDGNLKEVAERQHGNNMTFGSLFLGFVIGPVLDPPTACADGSACFGLLAADILCWVCLAICLFLAVCNSWTMAAIQQCVGTNSMPRWIRDNYGIYNMVQSLTVVSFTFLPAALSTRSVILLRDSPSYPSWLVWAVVAIIIGGGIGLQYAYWIVICTRTFTINSISDFTAFNLGLLGFRMPNEQLERAQVQVPVQYMD